MAFLMRLAAIALLVVPIYTGGCADNMDAPPPEQDEPLVQADDQPDDDDDYEPPQRELPDDEAEEPESDDQPDQPDEVDEETAIAEHDVPGVELVVDEDAPELEILSVTLEEGREQHYLSVECHDPEVDNTRWVAAHRSRYSRHCDIDLATAARAVSVEPSANVRIAPTPLGFRILGDFEKGEYDVELKAGLRSEEGSVLHETETESVDVPKLSESVEFVADGRYLPRYAWEKLNFRHRNVDEVDLKVRHVPSENMPFWLAQGSGSADETTSNVVVNTEVPVANRQDEILTSSVDIDEQLGEPDRGLYEMVLETGDDQAVSRLQVTDINLITKRNEAGPDDPWEEQIDLWAVDMETTEPLSNVRADVIRPSGETMAACRTDRDGHCRLELPDDPTDLTPPMAIIAERGDDLTYLKFDDLLIESGIEAVDGPAYRADKSYLASMYGDRDLYRPADTVHIFGALRDLDYSTAGEGVPTEVTVRDPEGETVIERNEDTDDLGTFDFSFPLSDAAPTGRWEATLEVGTREIETYTFHVEEFVPERMEVDVEPTEEIFVGDERPSFEVEARYLFGASGQGSEVELDCRLVPVDSPLDGGDYSYGPLEIEEDRSVIDLSPRNGVIGEDDTVEMSCPSPDRTPSGPMRAEATVAVAEGGSGRTTHGAADAKLMPSEMQVGLSTDNDDLKQGDVLTVDGRISDNDGELVDIEEPLILEFYNIRRQRSWQRDSSGRRTVHHDYQLILERAVDVEPAGGEFSVDTTVADVDHAYMVRAEIGGATTEMMIDRRGRMWHFGGHSDRTPQPRRPSEIGIETPDELVPGEETTVEFTAPFAGRALMTVETDEVVRKEWIDAEEGTNRHSFSVDTDEPNVYVATFIIRDPHDTSDDAFEPERAFGAVSMTVDRSGIETGVHLHHDDEVRPNEPMQIEIEAAGVGDTQAVATVAAVDEGILQLTGYDTPDPVDHVWNERAPGVDTFDTIGWATRLPPANPSSRTGGGAPPEAEASDGRIMPFEPVALWSGPVRLDENGRATVQFDVPQYSGRLRVMGAVITPDEMGSADADVVVRDPLTVQATFPRQLTEDDEAEVPVFLTNLTGEAREIDVEISGEPYDVEGFDATPGDDDTEVLEFPDGDDRSVELADGESTTMYFTTRAARPGGGAEIEVNVESGEHSSLDSGRIPFRPQGQTERQLFTSAISPGTNDLTEHLDGWVETTEETTLFVSNIPEPDAFDHLEYLIRYPFGCAEQTLSSARPLVVLSNLVQNVDPRFAGGGDGIDSKVDAGINRMLSMQHADGGVGFWPNHRWASIAYPRITAMTLDFFTQAVDQGYDVPEERIESAAEWLGRRVDGTPDDAFEHFVLARAGEPQTSDIRNAIDKLPEEPEGRDRERAYLLKAALYLAGDRSFEEELRDPDFTTAERGRAHGRFYSHRRQRALMLHIFVELFGRDAAAEDLAEAVTNDLTGNEYGRLNTQEIVWAVEALAGWYEFEGLDEIDINIEGNGRQIRPDSPGGYPTWSIHRASEFDQLDLNVDFGDYDGELMMMLNSRGVREDAEVETGGEGLFVNRTYLDRSGDEIRSGDVNPGDVVYVKVELENEANSGHRDLALVDRLPAGLEVENPDLGAAELPNWAEESWDTDHINTRDDRVEMFGDLSNNESITMVYPTRATMAGDFYVPPIEVEGMYDLQTWARGEEGRLRVEAAPES